MRSEFPSYSASPSVRHAVVDDLRVVLDLRTERYKVLDDAATALWAVLTGAGDTTPERLAARYDLDDERLRNELDAFARRCVEAGLLQRAGPAELRRAPTLRARRTRSMLPRTVRALASLVATQRALARDGFHSTYERYGLLPIDPVARGVQGVLPAFVRAENFFVARRAPDDCLLRSLALYRFLRSFGVPAQHVIAVRRFPFAAHAWVEYAGAALLDDTPLGFTTLARIGDPASRSSGPP